LINHFKNAFRTVKAFILKNGKQKVLNNIWKTIKNMLSKFDFAMEKKNCFERFSLSEK